MPTHHAHLDGPPKASQKVEESGMLAGEMRDAMKGWVTYGQENRHQFAAEGLIRMDIRHNHLEQRWHDLRFDVDNCIFMVKEKLHKHGAGSVAHMELYLRRGGDTIFLYDDNLTLRDFGAANDMELFVKDTDPYSMAANGGLEDVSQDYDKREKTLRAHFKAEKEKNPDFVVYAKSHPNGETSGIVERPTTPDNVSELFPIGGRCECNPGGRRGTIKYVGKVGKADGTFIGVELDEPLGMNDGSRDFFAKDGKTYFECKGPKYGCFSRHENVNVGDFPELDPFADLDDDDEI